MTKSKTEIVAGAEEKPTLEGEVKASGTKAKPSPKPKPEALPAAKAGPLPEGEFKPDTGMEERIDFFGGGAKDKQPPQESEEERGLKQSLKQLIDKLGQAIGSFANDVTTLDITTYYNTDVEGYVFKDGTFTGQEQPTPRAATYIKLDGDMVVVVPKADADLWAIHQEMVRMAQENRARLIEIAINAATSIVKVIG